MSKASEKIPLKAEADRDRFLSGWQDETKMKQAAEAEVERLKGLLEEQDKLVAGYVESSSDLLDANLRYQEMEKRLREWRKEALSPKSYDIGDVVRWIDHCLGEGE